MKTIVGLSVTGLSVIAAAFAVAPGVAFAAHAGAPYTNVDHRNDAGNDTGDSRVESLNAQQLDENYKGPYQVRTPSMQSAPPTVMMPIQPPTPDR